MKISVALCTYNGEDFLAEQLESILLQTRIPDEVIIRDDGSADATAGIIEAFARRFPGQVDFAVNEARRGVAGNFEGALARATGDLILVSDQDDIWCPDRTERAERAFMADPTLLLLFADARLVDASRQPVGMTQLQALGLCDDDRRRLRSGAAFSVLAVKNLVVGATVCLRRELLADALPVPTAWLHDEWLALIAAARGGIGLDESPVIDYRQHGANVIGRPPVTMTERIAAGFAGRLDRRGQLVEREAALLDRLQTIRAPIACRSLIAEKLLHARVRDELPSSRSLRVAPVLREVLTGRYQRCSNGWRSALGDLVYPIVSRR